MFLIYVDESGTPKSTEDYFILGAIAIYETQVYFLSKAFDDIQMKWFPNITDSIEFHAANIRNRSGAFHRFSPEDGRNIFVDLCAAITKITPKAMSLFGIAIHKASFPSDDPVEKAFHELCGHIDKFIEQDNLAEKSKNRALMILDSAKYSGHLDKLLLEYRKQGGTKFGRVFKFADSPAFANSSITRLLQAADIVSYSIFRYYQHEDTFLFNRLIGRFHQSDNKYHGLTHMISERWKCACPACLSRRK